MSLKNIILILSWGRLVYKFCGSIRIFNLVLIIWVKLLRLKTAREAWLNLSAWEQELFRFMPPINSNHGCFQYLKGSLMLMLSSSISFTFEIVLNIVLMSSVSFSLCWCLYPIERLAPATFQTGQIWLMSEEVPKASTNPNDSIYDMNFLFSHP